MDKTRGTTDSATIDLDDAIEAGHRARTEALRTMYGAIANWLRMKKTDRARPARQLAGSL